MDRMEQCCITNSIAEDKQVAFPLFFVSLQTVRYYSYRVIGEFLIVLNSWIFAVSVCVLCIHVVSMGIEFLFSIMATSIPVMGMRQYRVSITFCITLD